MTVITPQHLRDRLPDLLRRVQQGDQFSIVVDEMSVAELRPHHHERWVGRDRLLRLLASSPVPMLLDDVRRYPPG
jgi:antitoxin (DNA-binding transcriptional repressor) of toxin-antitoxin stability system